MEPAPERGLPLTSTELNSATSEDFRKRLPGVGDVLAKRIVTWREAHGPFASVRDLAGVPGITPRLLEKLSAYVFVAHSSSVRPRSIAPSISSIAPSISSIAPSMPPSIAPSSAAPSIAPRVQSSRAPIFPPFPMSGHPSFSFVPRISTRPVLTVVPKLVKIPGDLLVDPEEERFFAGAREKAASVAAPAKPPSPWKGRVVLLMLCLAGTTAGVAGALRIEERKPSSRVMDLTAQVAESRTRDTELRAELAARAVEWEAKTRSLQAAADQQAAQTEKLEREQARLEHEVAGIVDATKAEEKQVYQLGEAVKDIDFFMTLTGGEQRPIVVGKKPKSEPH